jgi:hypothetical protein
LKVNAFISPKQAEEVTMSTAPRRFVIVAPPRSTDWIGETLARAFGRPERIPAAIERLIERLDRVAMRKRRQ